MHDAGNGGYSWGGEGEHSRDDSCTFDVVVPPISYIKTPIANVKSTITYEKRPITYDQSPITHDKTLSAYEKNPITYEKSPITYEKSPIAYDQSMSTLDFGEGEVQWLDDDWCPPVRGGGRAGRVDVSGSAPIAAHLAPMYQSSEALAWRMQGGGEIGRGAGVDVDVVFVNMSCSACVWA